MPCLWLVETQDHEGAFQSQNVGRCSRQFSLCSLHISQVCSNSLTFNDFKSENMNGAAVMPAFMFLFATVLWFAWRRKVYPGPVTEALGVEICVETNFDRLKLLDLFEESWKMCRIADSKM